MDFNINNSKESQMYHAQIHLYKHVYNFVSSMTLKSVVELGISDVIHNHGQPMTLFELVSL